EMVIDQKVTESLNRSDYFQYIDELIVISKFSQKEDDTKLNTNNNLMSGFLLNEQSFLKNRIQFLLNEFQYKHTSKILLSLTLILPLLLTSTIVEPDYATPEKIKSTNRVHLNSSDYILQEGKHYYLILDGNNNGEIKNIHDKSIQ